MGHSGSTLLDVLLNQHEQIQSIGEVMFLDEWMEQKYLCSCGAKIHHCSFWKQVFERGNISLGSMDDPNYLNHSVALFEAIAKVSDAPVIVDSSKSPQRLQKLLAAPQLDVKVVHLVRNGLAVVNSLKKSHDRPGTGSDLRTPPTPAYRGILRWVKRNRQIERISRSLGANSFLRVRYEDLCQDPEGVLGEICELTGLEFNKAMLTPDLDNNHNISGSRWRFSEDDVVIKLDEKWKHQIGPGIKLLFQMIGGRLNKKYGYTFR